MGGKDGQVAIEKGDWTFRVVPELADRVDEILSALKSLEKNERAEKIKVTGGRRTIWTAPFSPAGLDRAFIKHYSKPDFAKQLKHVVRNSRTRQEWEMGVALEELGLPVARHLVMAEKRKGGLLQEDFLVQEYLDGYRNFDAWFRENFEAKDSARSAAEKKQAVLKLALLIRDMHDKGVLQRDFKPDSIMVGPEEDLKLVDLERMLIKKLPGGLFRNTRIDNISKIDQTFGHVGSMTNRLRFLNKYFEDESLSRTEMRDVAEKINELSEMKWRKRANERRVWTSQQNATYNQLEIDGFKISAHYSLPRDLLEKVVKEVGRASMRSCACPPTELYPREQRLKALWCDAERALSLAPGLFHRRTPFIPPRAAIRTGVEGFGLLLYLDPGPPFVTWKEAFERARDEGTEEDLAALLGRTLGALFRTGLSWTSLDPDTMLYDPEYPIVSHRFYVNRLDRLSIDRTPPESEARTILADVSAVLDLSAGARSALYSGYGSGLLRWFRLPDRF